jgi:carboxyl-terminal processing protease
LRLTTARYFTPSGRSIQARGITPDIIASQKFLPPQGETQQMREADLENHFDALPEKQIKMKDEDEQNSEDSDDYQLLRALELLKGFEILKGSNRAA